MSNFINGYNKPRIIVKNLDNTDPITYDFPFCDLSGGYTQGFNEDFGRHELANGTIYDFAFQGAKLQFNLSFGTLLTKDYYYNIQNIINAHRDPDNYKIILIPRIDVLAQQFEVRFASTKILDLGIHNNGQNAIGNRLTNLSFVTKENYYGQLFFNPDDLNRPLPYFIH